MSSGFVFLNLLISKVWPQNFRMNKQKKKRETKLEILIKNGKGEANHMKSEQSEQKVGCRKNVATNRCPRIS